ncbi:MAG TPA: pseudouridine synthase [Burkholderiaceae bacterium]|nr:pseudouridine synthase [Burkholderiaceae bacterium]
MTATTPNTKPPLPTTATAAAPAGPVFRRAAPPAIAQAATAKGAAPAKATIRLNKRMAELGLCSRREADDWVANGWVKVNGVVATMGQQVLPTDKIETDRIAKGQQANQVTILINKPIGYVSAQAEDGHQPAVTLFTPQNRWADDNARFFWNHSQLPGLAPCGRLDIDSVGLLVMTQDGRIARQLIGEDSNMEKEYLVRVAYYGSAEISKHSTPIAQNVQSVFPPELLAKLRFGLSLDGQPLRRARVDWQNPEQLRFILTEGKKRQIRRMCEQVGLKVVGLKRVRIGNIVLGNLPLGQWRYLTPHEKF